jgi:hypothetical protein
MDTPIDSTENALTTDQVAAKGQKIYDEKLKGILEAENKGKFVVIEVESGDYFVADTVLEALQKAKEKYPNKILHAIRIGYEGIFKMGSYARKGLSYGWDSSR